MVHGIEVVQTVPTICGPVADFKELTLASNAHTLGWMGFIAGGLFVGLLVLGYYFGPSVYWWLKDAWFEWDCFGLRGR